MSDPKYTDDYLSKSWPELGAGGARGIRIRRFAALLLELSVAISNNESMSKIVWRELISGGKVAVMGHDPAKAARRVIARELAYLPQQYELAFPFLAEEVVLLGRYANQRGLGLPSEADLAAAHAAMKACDVDALATRRFDELSGGEARRVILAQAVCQGAKCLLLDEPTAGLDPAHARSVFEMLRAQCDAGSAAVVVTHDLDLALRHGRTMWLVADGRLAARGTPAEVLDHPRVIESYLGTDATAIARSGAVTV